MLVQTLPEQPAAHLGDECRLASGMGAIEQGAEERMEVLKETAMSTQTKQILYKLECGVMDEKG